MRLNHLLKVGSNFFASVLLISLLSAPVFFASHFVKVAGVKTESKYLLVSQAEKFPNLTFSQNQDHYQVAFDKLGPSQAYLGIAIVNNPTDKSQTYELKVASGSAKLFFGEDLKNQLTKISLPSQVSVPVSLFSDQESSESSQTVEFKIEAK